MASANRSTNPFSDDDDSDDEVQFHPSFQHPQHPFTYERRANTDPDDRPDSALDVQDTRSTADALPRQAGDTPPGRPTAIQHSSPSSGSAIQLFASPVEPPVGPGRERRGDAPSTSAPKRHGS